MKRFCVFLALLFCLLSLAGCSSGKPDDTAAPPAGSDGPVLLRRYAFDGGAVSSKTVSAGPLASEILGELANAASTGKKAEKISDEPLSSFYSAPPVEPGTLWIEAGGLLYRASPDLSELFLVETHLGAGRGLAVSERCRSALYSAWYYYPYDYYSGSYQNRTDRLELTRMFEADSAVEIRVKKLEIKNEIDPVNKIAVELLSKDDRTVTLTLDCRQGADNLAAGDRRTLSLEAGKAETAELTFGGFRNVTYWITLAADNTMVSIAVEP